jgi:hypothetical protein
MDPLQNIVDRVKSAIEEGLTNVRVQAVFMDPAAETGDYQAYAEEMNNRALSIIAAVAGGVSPTLHRASEWWFLTINADKSFSSGLIDQGDSENDGNESAEEFYDESD